MPSRAQKLGFASVAALALFAASCSSDDGAETTNTSSSNAASESASGSLVGVCPDKIVIQTDWFATPERAAAYQLVGPDGEIDATAGAYRGPLGDTGVEVEVRLGGPFIGFSPIPQQMYTDTDIMLGYVGTDDAVLGATDFPTTAVVAPLDVNPQVIMWDPATYDIKEWSDVPGTQAKVSYVESLPFMKYLVAQGYVDESQLDSSFDGTPARFVAEEGKLIQEAYASNEPYRWEHDVEEWMKPVEYLLVHDAGYHIYPQGVAVRTDELEASSECLKAVVPMIQQAQVDYINDPQPTNDALVRIGEAIGDGPPITADANAAAVETMLAEKLVGNGPDDTLGNFDPERVTLTIDQMKPIWGADVEIPEDLSADDLVTNEFIDPSIHL